MESPPTAPATTGSTSVLTSARSGKAGHTLITLVLLAVGLLAATQAMPSFLAQLVQWGAIPRYTRRQRSLRPPRPLGERDRAGLSGTDLYRGAHAGTVPVTLYKGVFDAMPDRIVGYVSDDEVICYHRVVSEPSGQRYLHDLASTIDTMTDDPDDRARIAVSVVQHLDYDTARADGTYHGVRYPYETLYLGRGVCSDKSVLLAALLRELGFGVALIRFDVECHMAVGIRCQDGYDYLGTGYAFAESTTPSIITDAGGEYVGAGRLVSAPKVIPIAEGQAFASIANEDRDAAEWNELRGTGPVLDAYHYERWQALSREYDILPETG